MSAKRRKRELRKGAHLDTKVHPSQVPLQVIATVGKAMEAVKAMVVVAVREGIIALVVAVVINIVVQAMTKRNGKETKMCIHRRMGIMKKNYTANDVCQVLEEAWVAWAGRPGNAC